MIKIEGIKTYNKEERDVIKLLKHSCNTSIEGTPVAITQLSISEVKTLLNILQRLENERSELLGEVSSLNEQLREFIPRRRVRRVYKMLGKILSKDLEENEIDED